MRNSNLQFPENYSEPLGLSQDWNWEDFEVIGLVGYTITAIKLGIAA